MLTLYVAGYAIVVGLCVFGAGLCVVLLDRAVNG
jgi:hypothetical protein